MSSSDRLEKGKAFYLAMYAKDGAIWEANEHQELWCAMAEDYERRLASQSPSPTPGVKEMVERLRADTRSAVHCSLSEEAADMLERLAAQGGGGPSIWERCARIAERMIELDKKCMADPKDELLPAQRQSRIDAARFIALTIRLTEKQDAADPSQRQGSEG